MSRADQKGGVTSLRRPSLPAAAACLALLAFSAGCGDDEEQDSAANAPEAKKSLKVDIASFKYLPPDATLKAGGKITWVNQDKAPHTAETDPEAAGAFDTKRLDLGEKSTITFDKPGKYAYYCVYHRFMEGTVEVVE